MSSNIVKLSAVIVLLAGLFTPFAPAANVAAAAEQRAAGSPASNVARTQAAPLAATPIVGGTSFGSAVAVSPGLQYSAEVNGTHASDYFYFDVTPGQWLTLTFSSTLTWTGATFNLYDQNHLAALVLGVSLTGAEQTRTFRYLGSSTTPTRYYFVVTRIGGTDDYLFDIALANQADGGTPGDAGDTVATAKSVTATQGGHTIFAGNQLGYKDSDDWFKIVALSGQIVTVTVTVQDWAAAGNVSLALDDDAGAQLANHTIVKPVSQWTFNWISNNTYPSAYTLHVGAVSNTGTPLSYDVAIDLTQQADGNTPGDAGDNFDTARDLTVTVASPTLRAPGNLLGGSDRYDYYRLNLPVPPLMQLPQRYTLWLDQIVWPDGIGKFTVKLFDGARNQIGGRLYYITAPATAPLGIDVTACPTTGCYLYIETTYYSTYHTSYRLQLSPIFVYLPALKR